MYSFPDTSSRPVAYPGSFQETSFSGSSQRRGISSYESMDAGLTIKTREGDIVTLNTSRFSELNAREYESQGYLTTEDGQVSSRTHERQIELASGESFSFSVQGDLNEQELADIANIVSGVDSIIYEMAQGDMDEAVALALSMGSYDSVSFFQADISMTRSYSAYAETRTADTGSGLPAPGRGVGLGGMLPSAFASPFMNKVSSLLDAQKAEALAHARQPLTQLFDHYLEKEADRLESSGDKAGAVPETAGKSPMVLALEATARTVDQLIQEMVKEVFGNILDQMA